MNIERNIGIKAVGIYMLTLIIVLLIGVYIFNAREEIQKQRELIENQRAVISLTHEIIHAVNEVQMFGSQYIASNNTEYINKLDNEMSRIDSLIHVVSEKQDVPKSDFLKISKLLDKQVDNLYQLNNRMEAVNPLTDIQKRLKAYNPPVNETTSTITIRQDTIIKTREKKNFFGRLKEVFSPVEDSTMYITNQRVDTIKLEKVDSLSILSEVDTLIQDASVQYEEKIKDLEKHINILIHADRELAAQISTLLTELHAHTLNIVVNTISKSEISIQKNTTISVIAGIVALILILVFILLILYDVNKGKKAREKLKQVMDSRHQLLLAVSHDIKSPLSAILAYLNSKDGADIRTMQHAAKHILSMLENLLEYSSLEQGTLQVTVSDVDLKQICCETVDMFTHTAEMKGLSLHLQANNAYIRSDEMKLKQIIINLISNAIKYTQQGFVDVQAHHTADLLTIRVQDSGVGIPENQLTEIYKPFMRVEKNNALAFGSGFGMYVVRGLVDLLDGFIHIESKEGKGTCIEVNIPVKKAYKNIQKGTQKITIYDDDPIMVELVGDMLQQLGHKIVEQDCDVILTDMEMGNISGLDILAKAGDVPVVLMTGKADYTAEKADKLGFTGFISKPFNLSNLRAVFGEGDDYGEQDFQIESDEEIMTLFRTSTLENKSILQEALDTENFNLAQSICHKMLPMFAQLGYSTTELKRMDASRGKAYEAWRVDVKQILNITV